MPIQLQQILVKLNKQFENRLRLGVMSILMVNDWVDFNTLKDMLQATDGNLASHLATLEKHDLIAVKKEFVGKKTRTSYQATRKGRTAFEDHLAALEQLLKAGGSLPSQNLPGGPPSLS